MATQAFGCCRFQPVYWCRPGRQISMCCLGLTAVIWQAYRATALCVCDSVTRVMIC